MIRNLRIQLTFGQESAARLARLKGLTEAGSYSEVIANALKLYEGIIDEGGHRAKLVVQKDDGTTTILRVFT